MGNYKIKVNFDIVDENNPDDKTTVTLDAPLIKDNIESIDDFEKILLRLVREALRKLMIEHFSELSKKKALDEQRKVGGSLRENTTRYRVDGEIGKIEFKTHSLISENDEKIIFNTAKDVFRTLMSKELYRTECFDEIVFDSLTDTTYRKTSKRLNRMRWQEIGGTPVKTLANIVDTEVRKIEEFINELTDEIFNENDFSAEGIPNNELIEYGLDEIAASLDTELINNAINKYNENKESDFKIDIGEVRSFIENPERTVNISVDDVNVKKQKIKRNDDLKKEKKNMLEILLFILKKKKVTIF